MTFDFDDQKRFSQNLDDFFAAMEQVDTDMARILRANADKLALIVRDGERNTAARTEFNAAVAAALDEMLARPEEGEAS